jgi:undecaprenyl-diphosphatase
VAHPLDYGTAAVLGFIQGVTEFLPISSDGHLAIAQYFMQITDGGLALTVLLHVGTLVATFAVLGKDVRRLVVATLNGLRTPRAFAATDDGKETLAIIAATIPTAVVGLLLKDVVEPLSRDLRVVGVCLLVTAGLVASTKKLDHGEKETLDVPRAVLLGLAQGLAVLPGLSRSGTTIAFGMAMGLRPEAAFRLSFLLSLPAVLGACVLELGDPEVLATFGAPALFGAAVSLVVGYVALRSLRGVIARGRFAFFALYLVPLGLAMLALGESMLGGSR